MPVREGQATAAAIAASRPVTPSFFSRTATMQSTLSLADDLVSTDVLPPADADATRHVLDGLANSPYMPLRVFVHCACRNGVVTLSGNLPSFFLKQLAQRIAMNVGGVERVINEICVDVLPVG